MTTRKNSSRSYRSVRSGLNRPFPRSAPLRRFWVRAGGGTSAIGGWVVVVGISALPGSGDVDQVRHDQHQDDEQQDRADCRGVGVVVAALEREHVDGRHLGLVVRRLRDRHDQVEDLQRHVADDDDGGEGHRTELGEEHQPVHLPLRGPVDLRRLTQLVWDAAEAGKEQRHDVPGELPDRRDGDGCDAGVDVVPPVVLQEPEAGHLEQPVQTGRLLALVGVEQPPPHDAGGDEGHRHGEQVDRAEDPLEPDRPVRFEGVFRSVYLFPMAVSFVASGVVWRWLLNSNQGEQASGLNRLFQMAGLGFLQNNWWNNVDTGIAAIAIPAIWQLAGYVMALFLAGFRGIPDELREAAKIDGASEWQMYRLVLFPQLSPVALSAVIIIGHMSLKVFDLIMSSSKPANYQTKVPAIDMFTLKGSYNYADSAAVGVVVAALEREHVDGRHLGLVVRRLRDRHDQVEDLQRHVADDDDGGQGHRTELGEEHQPVHLPLRGPVDLRRLTQLVWDAAEAGKEQRHDVPGELPDRRDGDGCDAGVDVVPPVVLQE